MCTVTVYREESKVLVTMNRDEARSRAQEIPPKVIEEKDSPRWIAPIDSQSGGTWIGANEFGIVACLLNGNALEGEELDKLEEVSRPSRGTIIPYLLTRRTLTKAVDWLFLDFDPSLYAPFVLVVVSGMRGRRFVWTGKGGLIRSELCFRWELCTSSSWKVREVTQLRQHVFDKWRTEGSPFEGYLPRVNVLRIPGKEKYSPLMDRERSATRSITQVGVDYKKKSIEMSYWPRLYDNTIFGKPHSSTELSFYGFDSSGEPLRGFFG